jgi:hypothetical protein
MWLILTWFTVDNGWNYWIGGNKIKDGEFTWGAGQPFSYTTWHNQPEADDDQDCVEMLREDSKTAWHNTGCHRKRAFICELDPKCSILM